MQNDNGKQFIMAEGLSIEITTPQKQWRFEHAASCTAPGVLGNFQVLQNHAPLMSELTIGELKVVVDGDEKYFAVSGGFLEVKNNVVSLVLEACEAADEIDVERAQRAMERAKQRLKERRPDLDVVRAEAALTRALNRLRVARKKTATT